MRSLRTVAFGVAFLVVIVTTGLLHAPENVGAEIATMPMGESCDFMCQDCFGGGHEYGALGEPATGNDPHGCGTVQCDETSAHEWCEGGGANFALGDYQQMKVDAARLLEHEHLSGEQLYDIVARSDGRFYINQERRSLQQRDCDDPRQIVANLPLTERQLSGFARAEAEDG